MIRTIMIPLDGSAFGEHALPLALGIAKRAGAQVRLVHVCEPPTPSRFFERAPAPNGEAHARQANYLAHLAAALAPRWEVSISTAVIDGAAAPALHAEAVAQAADLVVLTTHGYGPLTRMWLGGVANALVRTLPMPVLLTRPRGETTDLLESVNLTPFQRVLVPLDGSPAAEAALAPAMAIGQLMSAEYTLAQAIELPMLGYAPAAHVAGLEQRILEEWQILAQQSLDRAAEIMRGQGAAATTRVLFGPTAPAITDYARDHACDLIAMATYGRSGVARALLGSVAERVVQYASVPVLLCRPGEGGSA